jgi:hypothetical protein
MDVRPKTIAEIRTKTTHQHSTKQKYKQTTKPTRRDERSNEAAASATQQFANAIQRDHCMPYKRPTITNRHGVARATRTLIGLDVVGDHLLGDGAVLLREALLLGFAQRGANCLLAAGHDWMSGLGTEK